MAKYKLEYIWLDGYEPVANLRSKTTVKEFETAPTLAEIPMWNFDGSSTRQAEGKVLIVYSSRWRFMLIRRKRMDFLSWLRS